jgi:hypothetical protein
VNLLLKEHLARSNKIDILLSIFFVTVIKLILVVVDITFITWG